MTRLQLEETTTQYASHIGTYYIVNSDNILILSLDQSMVKNEGNFLLILSEDSWSRSPLRVQGEEICGEYLFIIIPSLIVYTEVQKEFGSVEMVWHIMKPEMQSVLQTDRNPGTDRGTEETLWEDRGHIV